MAPRFAYCADDFTGASDTLANLSRAGLSARLFLRIEDVIEAARTERLDAVGLATSLRAMTSADAGTLMREIAPGLASVGAQFVHFKICSTFDSSAAVGNICAVGDCLAEAIGAAWIAIIGGQPSLGRYCVFGNLFAAAGDEAVHRIDRHPTMSVHPVTPMTEADLRRHLATQGWPMVGLVDVRASAAGSDALRETIESRLARGERHVLFDAAQQADLVVIGDALASIMPERRALLIGSSSVVEALFGSKGSPQTSGPVRLDGPVFAFAGSRSIITADQVAEATRFHILTIEPDDILQESPRAREIEEACQSSLRSGGHVLVQLSARRNASGGQALATASGAFIKRVLDGARPGCLVIAGGDTSSAAIQTIGVESFSFIAEINPGVPIVRAHSRNAIDALPMVLKGGQVGRPGIFDALAGLSAA